MGILCDVCLPLMSPAAAEACFRRRRTTGHSFAVAVAVAGVLPHVAPYYYPPICRAETGGQVGSSRDCSLTNQLLNTTESVHH
ncbi:unnamed protein product [Urochloa humidicola]